MKWAFIFHDPSLTETKMTTMEHSGNLLYVCGVNTIEAGAQLARTLWETDHCELAELCGGFGPEGAKRVMEVTEGKVRVGYVTKKFPPEI